MITTLARRALRHLHRAIPPRDPDTVEFQAVYEASDLRSTRTRLADLGTLQMGAVTPAYGDPTRDQPGTNRWDHPLAAHPWVKTGPDRWVSLAADQARRDHEMTGCIPSTRRWWP